MTSQASARSERTRTMSAARPLASVVTLAKSVSMRSISWWKVVVGGVTPVISMVTLGEHHIWWSINGVKPGSLTRWDRQHITTQLAIYKGYISGIYCHLGDNRLPTTYLGNQKQLLNQWVEYGELDLVWWIAQLYGLTVGFWDGKSAPRISTKMQCTVYFILIIFQL